MGYRVTGSGLRAQFDPFPNLPPAQSSMQAWRRIESSCFEGGGTHELKVCNCKIRVWLVWCTLYETPFNTAC